MDKTPTANSVQFWLKEIKQLTDRFLRDFSAAWTGAGDAKLPDAYVNECVKYERQHKDDAVAIPVPGTSVMLHLDNYGNLIIVGGGRQHIEVPLANFDAAYQSLPRPGSIPDPIQAPPAPQSGLMSQNESAVLKAERRFQADEPAAAQARRKWHYK